MKAAVLYGNYDLRYEDYPEPTIKPGCVKIKVCACGICGSDFPRITSDGAHFYPIVLGHEFSGYVTEIAEDVKEKINIGDHVTCAPLVPCLKCDDCKNGHYSLCKHYSFIGSREQGAYADYIVVPSKNLTVIDKSIPYEQGAMFEPSTIALHAIELAEYTAGKNVAVLGCGTMGIMTIQWAKILGANKIAAFNLSKGKEAIAKKYGADVFFSTLDDDYIEQAKLFTDGKGFDYVFETAGSTQTMKLTYQLVKNRGSVCMIGTPKKAIEFSVEEWELLNRKEFKLTGSWMSGNKPWPGNEWTMTSDHLVKGDLVFDDDLFHKKIPLSKPEELIKILKNKEKINGRIIFTNY